MPTHRTDSAPPGRPLPARDSAGFSLIELLAALLVTALVAASVVAVLSAHGHVARRQAGQEEARQNARAALELITSELRSVGPDGILAADRDGITFRSPRAWGIVCSHTPERIAAVFPSAAVPALRTGDESLALPPVGASSAWQFLDVSDLTGSAAERSAAQEACAALEGSAASVDGTRSPVRMYAPRWEGATLGIPPGAPGLRAGTPLYAFDDVRYQVARAAGTEIHWIRRNTGPAMLMHPLAGPVPEHGGLVFGYLDAAGAALPLPATPAERAAVAGVEVTVVAHSREAGDAVPLRDSVSMVVHLRNRP